MYTTGHNKQANKQLTEHAEHALGHWERRKNAKKRGKKKEKKKKEKKKKEKERKKEEIHIPMFVYMQTDVDWHIYTQWLQGFFKIKWSH